MKATVSRTRTVGVRMPDKSFAEFINHSPADDVTDRKQVQEFIQITDNQLAEATVLAVTSPNELAKTFENVRQIKAENQYQTVIVVYEGLPDTEAAELRTAVLAAGADDFITNPAADLAWALRGRHAVNTIMHSFSNGETAKLAAYQAAHGPNIDIVTGVNEQARLSKQMLAEMYLNKIESEQREPTPEEAAFLERARPVRWRPEDQLNIISAEHIKPDSANIGWFGVGGKACAILFKASEIHENAHIRNMFQTACMMARGGGTGIIVVMDDPNLQAPRPEKASACPGDLFGETVIYVKDEPNALQHAVDTCHQMSCTIQAQAALHFSPTDRIASFNMLVEDVEDDDNLTLITNVRLHDKGLCQDGQLGILNRPAFERIARSSLSVSAYNKSPAHIMLIDMLQLGEINNNTSPEFGDIAIQILTEVMQDALTEWQNLDKNASEPETTSPETSPVKMAELARMGRGDEFGIIFEGYTLKEIREFCTILDTNVKIASAKLIKQQEILFEDLPPEKRIPLALHVGIASLSDELDTLGKMLGAANEHIIASKRHTRAMKPRPEPEPDMTH